MSDYGKFVGMMRTKAPSRWPLPRPAPAGAGEQVLMAALVAADSGKCLRPRDKISPLGQDNLFDKYTGKLYDYKSNWSFADCMIPGDVIQNE